MAADAVADASSSQDNSHLLSPPRLPPNQAKERRQPSITPRKFQRFFTPRSRVSSQPSAARRALRDLTAHALNRYQTPSSPLKPPAESDGSEVEVSEPPRAVKRRKLRSSPESSPIKPPSNLIVTTTPAPAAQAGAKPALLSPIDSLQPSQLSQELSDSEDEVSEPDLLSDTSAGKIVPLTQRGFGAQLVQRQIGGMPYAGRQSMSHPIADWRMETADFCSKPEDVHMCSSHEGAARCIPFCVAACHSKQQSRSSRDEEGRVRLLDSSESDKFNKIHLSFPAHGNAIIDLAFSEDDYVLASASGDQTGKVIDMMTQTPVSILGHHTASLKQVKFQPGRGGGSVLATSSRDGSVQIWDLRCKGAPVQDFTIEREAALGYRLPRKITQGGVVNSIYDAHARTLRQARQQTQAASVDVATRWEVPGRIGEVSVTAIHFMPAGREHLILSACEADGNIKLWDIRNVHTSRHKTSTPVSFTMPPDSHNQWRPFGISSMSLSTDGARLYALCKDNTVYAYATSHLILGHAPELSSHGDPPRRRNGTAQEGLGPIYGLRHDNFHATSFYVKSAIRPMREGRSELLAVGSSDGCAVLFPTDERYFKTSTGNNAPHEAVNQAPTFSSVLTRSQRQQRPALARTNSVSSIGGPRAVDTIPIYRVGTPLVRGHDKEVGAVCWTDRGKLVSLGDDYLVRCWGEDRNRASQLRTGGEAGGQRWACGWAEVGDGWDDDEW